MKVNQLIKELKKIRNEYGNIEVARFDALDYEDNNGEIPIEEVSYEYNPSYENYIILY